MSKGSAINAGAGVVSFPMSHLRCFHRFSHPDDISAGMEVVRSYMAKERTVDKYWNAHTIRTIVAHAINQIEPFTCVVAVSMRDSALTNWRTVSFAMVEIPPLTKIAVASSAIGKEEGEEEVNKPYFTVRRMYVTPDYQTSISKSVLFEWVRSTVQTLVKLDEPQRILKFLDVGGHANNANANESKDTKSATADTVVSYNKTAQITAAFTRSLRGVRFFGSLAPSSGQSSAKPSISDHELEPARFLAMSVSDAKKAQYYDTKAVGSAFDAGISVTSQPGSGGGSGGSDLTYKLTAVNGESMSSVSHALRLSCMTIPIVIEFVKSSKLFEEQHRKLVVWAHASTYCCPPHHIPSSRNVLDTDSDAMFARAGVDVQVLKRSPLNAVLHVELATVELDVQRTREVYSRIAFGCRTKNGQLALLRHVLMSGAVIQLMAVDRDVVVAEAIVRCEKKVNVNMLFSHIETPRARSAESDAALLEYAKEARGYLKFMTSCATYPSGEPFRYSHLPETIQSCMGPLPLLLYYWNAEQTEIGSDQWQIETLVNTMIYMTCIELAWTMEQYTRSMKQDHLVDQFLARVIRRIPSLMAYSLDVHGESFSSPFSEVDLMHASVDCEELSGACALMVKYIRASHGELATPLRERLAGYTGIHTIVTTRVGPINKIDKKGDGLHSLYWLVPTAMIDRMRSRVYGTKAAQQSYQKAAKAGIGNLNVIQMECLTDAHGLRSGSLARTVGSQELPVLSSLLGRVMTSSELLDCKYQQSIVSVYSVESRGNGPHEYYPVTFNTRTNKWDHGINVAAFWDMADEMCCFGFSDGPVVSQKALAGARDVWVETQKSNCIHITPQLVQLTSNLVDSLAAKVARVKRVHFLLYNEQETGVPLADRVDEEVELSKERAKQLDIKGYESLTATVHSVPFYVMDGMEMHMILIDALNRSKS